MHWSLILVSLYLRVFCGCLATFTPTYNERDVVAVGEEVPREDLKFKVIRVQRQQPQQLVEHNFLVGIASLGALHQNNTQCGQELEMLLEGIAKHKVWALKVLDHFGRPPKSFTWGNYFWFGTPDLCDDLNQPFAISLEQTQPLIFNATSPYPMNFVMVYLNFSTPYYIDLKLPFKNFIHLGLCLPKSCNPQSVRSLVDLYFRSGNFETQQRFDLDLNAVEVKIPHFSFRYFTQTATVVFFLLLFTFIGMAVVAESVHKSKHNLQIQHSLYKKNKNHHQTTNIPIPPQLLTNGDGTGDGGGVGGESSYPKQCEKLLMCFHLSANYETVVRVENSNSNSIFLSAMAGMRCIICLWITVFHVYYYSLFAMSNTPFIFAKLEKFALQPILQACFYVDVFFIMSSFLLVYNFLSNTKQMEKMANATWCENLKMFINSLLQRYIRLTPVMIFTMLLSTMTVDFLNMFSPFRLGEHSGLYCKTNWWYNLFYIHNLLDMNSICCSWTWYLACEMQYFVLFTALLHLYVKHPNAAKIVFVTLALGFAVIGWISNYANGITFEIDVIYSTLNQLYVKPWVRIPPYVGGAAMGWLMHMLQQQRQQVGGAATGLAEQQQTQPPPQPQQQQQQHQQHQSPQRQTEESTWNRVRYKMFWLACIVVYVATNFMSYWRSTPSWAVATIMSLGKLLFAPCIGGVIIMCARGRGGVLQALLSARPLLFLSKFCFSIYMLAPIVVVAMFGLRNEPTNFTEVGSAADFLAIISLAIVAAFIAYILVELPMQRLANVLLRGKRT